MKEIGGYFELELRNGEEYYTNAIKLNTARNAFEYILRAKQYKKVYLPYFTCDVMLEPVKKLQLEYEFYHINAQLEPEFDYDLVKENEALVYTNYFGIKAEFVKGISNNCLNLIIDNSQAFFEQPIVGIDTFYSARKFFGVPDGAYLFTNKLLSADLLHDNSVHRFSHLIKRIDEGAQAGYDDFKLNDQSLQNQTIKLMSILTHSLLCNIDYENVIRSRKENFKKYIHSLQNSNGIIISEQTESVPMVYPYFTSNGKELKQALINNGIFVATYWPNVLNRMNEDDCEYQLANKIVCLPLDQRQSSSEIEFIIENIKMFYEGYN